MKDHAPDMFLPMIEAQVAEKRKYFEWGEELRKEMREATTTMPWITRPYMWWLRSRIWWYHGINKRRLARAMYLEQKLREAKSRG